MYKEKTDIIYSLQNISFYYNTRVLRFVLTRHAINHNSQKHCFPNKDIVLDPAGKVYASV